MLLLHLLLAAIWVGGHLFLCLRVLPRALRERDPRRILDFERAYEPMGLPALAGQLLTGLWLAHRLLPDWGRWLEPTDPMTRLVWAKLLLLVLTVGFAVHARFRLLPGLTADRLPILAAHIVGVTVFGVLFVSVGVAFRTGRFW